MPKVKHGGRGSLREVTVWFWFCFRSFFQEEKVEEWVLENSRTASYGSWANNSY